MRIGISISESGKESNLKSVFSRVGFEGEEEEADEDSLRLQDESRMNAKNKSRQLIFISYQFSRFGNNDATLSQYGITG